MGLLHSSFEVYSLITLGKLMLCSQYLVILVINFQLKFVVLSQGPKGLSIPLNISKRKNIESFYWYIS